MGLPDVIPQLLTVLPHSARLHGPVLLIWLATSAVAALMIWKYPKWTAFLLIAAASFLGVTTIPVTFYGTCQTAADCWKQQHEVRLAVIQSCAGLFALYGLYLAVERIEQSKRDFQQRQELDRHSRFIQTMKLLGSVRNNGQDQKEPNIEARMGAVRALVRLRTEDSNFNDIVTVLNDYVREALRREPSVLPDNSTGEMPPDGWRDTADGPFRPDIRAALEEIVRQAGDTRLKFGNTFIKGIELTGYKLSADFSGALLSDGNLYSCDLTGSKFKGSIMLHANLGGTTIGGADFTSAVLTDTTFQDSSLSNSDFSGAMLRNVNLTSSDLRNVSFQGAQLTDAQLAGANLHGANFVDADITGCSFDNADLEKAVFYDAAKAREAVGLAVDQIVQARNWRTAIFSSDFRSQLIATAGWQ